MFFATRLYFSAFIALWGSFQFGWNIGVINNARPAVESFLNETLYRRSLSVTEDNVEFIFAVIVSIFPLGGLFGGLLGGWWAEYFGRVRGLWLSNIFIVAAALTFILAPVVHLYEFIILGRFIIGFASGLFTGLVPLYLTEIAPVKVRGSFGVLNQLGVVSGIFLSQVMGLPQLLGNAMHWSHLLGIPLLPALLQLLCLPFCPESPRYLLLGCRNEKDARRSLLSLRGGRSVEHEVDEMKLEKGEEDEANVSIFQLFCDRHLRHSVSIVIALHVSQQLSGINNIFYYSQSLFEALSLSSEASSFFTPVVGLIMVTMTIVSIPLMEYAGRRDLHLLGLAGIMICSVIFTVSYMLQSTQNFLKYISVVFALLFVMCFALGPGSIPWIVPTEIFRQSARASAVGVGVIVNWFLNVIVGLVFIYLLKFLGYFVFVPYTICTALCFLYLFMYMIETKNRTVEENVERLRIAANARARDNCDCCTNTF